MTRRLLALFAPWLLAAQTEVTIESGRVVKRVPRISRPRNGECPVCGTMAQPHTVRVCPDGEVCLPVQDGGIAAWRRVDCEHCNATFRQWAEGKEPKR